MRLEKTEASVLGIPYHLSESVSICISISISLGCLAWGKPAAMWEHLSGEELKPLAFSQRKGGLTAMYKQAWKWNFLPHWNLKTPEAVAQQLDSRESPARTFQLSHSNCQYSEAM